MNCYKDDAEQGFYKMGEETEGDRFGNAEVR